MIEYVAASQSPHSYLLEKMISFNYILDRLSYKGYQEIFDWYIFHRETTIQVFAKKGMKIISRIMWKKSDTFPYEL